MVDASRFWDRLAKRYSRHKVGDEASYRRKLEETRAYLTPASEVLEIGCGTGTTALSHAPFAKHIHAIDFSSKMLEIARGKASAAGIINVDFEQVSIDGLDVPDGSLDMVMAHSILHLLAGWETAILRSFAMLKPGGVLVTSTTCLGDGMAFLRIVAPVGAVLGVFPVLAIFKRAELTASIRAAGYLIETEWQPGKGKAVFIVARKPVGDDA